MGRILAQSAKRMTAFLAFLIGSSLSVVPQCDVKFFLSNAEHERQEIKVGARGRPELLAVEGDVKIFCHGWMDNLRSSKFSILKEEYLKRGVKNVIGMDWSEHSRGIYSASVDVIEDVGHYLGLFIEDLHGGYNVSMSQIHLIGYSLGAHACGYAGQYVKSLGRDVIGRITGLDPAGPRFEGASQDQRLSVDDAIFVDVIHTDGGVLGCKASMGHIDFFPNGGVGLQPGCDLYDISCSHNKAAEYFMESINSDAFVAVSCDNYSYFQERKCDDTVRVIMGENVNRSARGNFYLNTNVTSPFALG